MNREISKSILLAALVLLSLFLTWSIWTYQGNFESKYTDKTPDIKPINPEIDLAFNDVVKPYQLIHIKNKSIYGTDSPSMVDTVYKDVLNAKWATFLGDLNAQGDESYELVFPSPIKMDTLQTLFNFTPNKTSLRHDWLIDRISIYQQKEKAQTVLVFKGMDETPKFIATSNEMVLRDINVKSNVAKYFHNYVSVKIKGKQVYVPQGQVKYDKMTNPFTLVDIKEFRPIFFSNLYKTYYDKGAYSDGDSFLKQDDNGYILRYINPPTANNSVLRDPIYVGYSFINSHSGWTNSFVYDYFDSMLGENQDDVDFRMVQAPDGLPVYSDNPTESMISLTWKKGVLYKLDRTLIKVGKPLSQEPTAIRSWDQVRNILEKGHIPINSLQDLRIGYQMDPLSNARLVNFTPDWFYKIGDHWNSVTDFESRTPTPSTSMDGGGKQ